MLNSRNKKLAARLYRSEQFLDKIESGYFTSYIHEDEVKEVRETIKNIREREVDIEQIIPELDDVVVVDTVPFADIYDELLRDREVLFMIGELDLVDLVGEDEYLKAWQYVAENIWSFVPESMCGDDCDAIEEETANYFKYLDLDGFRRLQYKISICEA